MSYILATIIEINNVDHLNIIKFDFKGTSLTMMSLDLSADMCVGKKVNLAVKPSHIALAKDFSGIVSYSNQIKATITSVENGTLLSNIKLLVKGVFLESIITKEAALKMDLKVDDAVTIMIKASEVSIVEVLDD